MALAFGQKKSAQTTGANALAYNSAIGGTGSALAAIVFWNNTSALTSMSDGRNGAWTAIGTRKQGTGNLTGWSMQAFVMLAPAAGATTVTATPSAAVEVGLVIFEYIGYTGTPTLTGTGVYSDHTTSGGTGSQTLSTSAITTTIASAIVVAGVFPANAMGANVNNWTAPFTQRDGGLGGDATWGSGGYAENVVSSTQASLTASYIVNQGASTDENIDVIFAIGDSVGGGSAPVNTVAPAVTGTVAAGKTLSCTTGTWTGDTSSGFAYQWKDGSGNIASATSSTYVVGAGEKTRSIHCTVTATGTGGSTSQDSNTVGPIGTSTGNLAGRFAFQGLIVDDAVSTGGAPNYRILKRRRT